MYHLSYPLMTASFLLIWLVLWKCQPDHRLAMFWTSFLFGIAGPIGELCLIPQYWHPQYLLGMSMGGYYFGIEDYLITFASAGIATGFFEVFAKRTGMSCITGRPRGTRRIMGFWGAIGLIMFIILYAVFGMLAIHASLLSIMLTTILMLRRRWVIYRLAVPVALISGLVFWLYYKLFFLKLFPDFFQDVFNLDNTFGIMLAGVPIEEPMWAFVTVLFSGPVYRICAEKASVMRFQERGLSQ